MLPLVSEIQYVTEDIIINTQTDGHYKFSKQWFSSNTRNDVSVHFLHILALQHIWGLPM